MRTGGASSGSLAVLELRNVIDPPAHATVARDRIAELDGVSVLGPEVKSDTSSG